MVKPSITLVTACAERMAPLLICRVLAGPVMVMADAPSKTNELMAVAVPVRGAPGLVSKRTFCQVLPVRAL